MMSLMRKEPRFGFGMMNLSDECNRMFNDFCGCGDEQSRWLPSVDIIEDKDKFMLTAELPGVKKEDVKISLNGNTLVIEGEKKSVEEHKDKDYHHTERFYGKFSRSFTLNSEVEADKIKADYQNGILTVTLPKSEKVKPRSININ